MSKKVDVLLSVYRPNMEYLQKQLESLDKQTYRNMEILVYDDCPKHRCDITVFAQCLKYKKYRILPYEEENIGYTKAFEKLVKHADGDYIAFCDQDDIWREDKIEKSVAQLEKDHTLLVASDRQLIDENDKVICESVKQTSLKPYDTWNSFDDIFKYNIFICYAVGMSIVVDGDLVRRSIPFSTHTGHDKWVIACAAAEGHVSYINDTLVQYRRHGNNVSGVLKGIKTKQDYINYRVMDHIGIVEDIKKKYPQQKDLQEVRSFAYARKNGNIYKLWKYRYLSPDVAKFEIIMNLMPTFLFKWLVKGAQMSSK